MTRLGPAVRVLALAASVAAAVIAGDRGGPAAAGPPRPASGTGSDQGLIVLPTPLDFGGVDVGSTTTLGLQLENTETSTSITISAPLGKPSTTQCNAFTFVTPPTLPDVIPPMTTHTWQLQFHPLAAGLYDCQWLLNDDDGNDDYVELTGFADTGALSVFPDPVDFSGVAVNDTASLTVNVYDAGSGSLKVSGIALTAGGPAFSLANVPILPVVIPASGSTQFDVHFHPTAMTGYAGTVTITSDDPANPSYPLDLVGSGGSGSGSGAVISLSPSPVDFGSVPVATTGTATLTVGDPGTSQLDVSSMDIGGGSGSGTTGDFSFDDTPLGCTTGQSCSAPYAVPAAGTRDVLLACKPTSAGLRFTTLSVSSDAGSGPATVTLQCTGAAPHISVSPLSMSFGTIRVGNTSMQDLTIDNTGTQPLQVTSATLEGSDPGDFGLSACQTGCTIPAGTSTIVAVTFTPTVRGARSANLHIASNDPAQPSVVVPLDGSGGAGVLVITDPSSASIDFGQIPVLTTSTSSPITVQNQGELSLTVQPVTATPAAFGVTGPSTAVTLAPGQTATWDVTCTPPTATGISGSATVTSDALTDAIQMVTLQCTGVVTTLTASPAPVSFGEVRTDRTAMKAVTVTNLGATAVTIQSASASPGVFTETAVGGLPATLGQNQQLEVDVTFQPTAEGGVTGALTLTDPGGATLLTDTLNGTGRVPSYQVTPPMLDFGTMCVGQSDSQDVTVKNDGTATIRLASATITTGASTFSISGGDVGGGLDLAPTQTHVVSIVGLASAGSQQGQLTVTTDLTTGGTTQVPLTIDGTQSGVALNPSQLGFGPQPIGVATAPADVTLTNCSTAGVVVTAASIAGTDAAAFELTGSQTATIGVGGSHTWSVVFTAQHLGSHTANLVLATDAGPMTVPLSGDGVAAGDGGIDGNMGDFGVGHGADSTSYYACACRTGASPGGGVPIALALLIALRRRRPRR